MSNEINASPTQAHDHNVGNILSVLTLMRNNTVALEKNVIFLQQENEGLKQRILELEKQLSVSKANEKPTL